MMSIRFLLERDHSQELLSQLDEKIRIAQDDLDEVRRKGTGRRKNTMRWKTEMAKLEEGSSSGQEILNGILWKREIYPVVLR